MSDLGRAACVARDAAGSKPRISLLEIMMYLRRWPTPGCSIIEGADQAQWSLTTGMPWAFSRPTSRQA